MELVNSGMRKGIKTMCVVAQTAQFVSLMPKPMDFITRVVGDVVYLSSQVNKLSDEMNKLLDSYAEIPSNYLMTQMNSITGSLVNITNRLSTYTQNDVNQVMGLGENAIETISGLTGAVIDTTGEAVNAVTGLGTTVVESGTSVIGNPDVSTSIHDGAEAIMEWTGDTFKNIRETVTKPLNDASNIIKSTKEKANNSIQKTANKVTSTLEDAQKYVSDLIKNLRDKMKQLENAVDGGFKDVTGLSSIANGADQINQALKESDNNSASSQTAQAISASLSEVIKNFSIGKVVAAFAGVLTQSTIVKFGLDQLPPIDFESMLCKLRDDMKMSTEDLYEQYNKINKELDSIYNDYIQFGEDSVKIPTEERDYSAENYKNFLKAYDSELAEQREKIRNLMKVNAAETGKMNIEIKKELRSAIKEVQKYRKQVKNAKQTKTLQEIINEELGNLKKEAEYRCNGIKSDWNSMMEQYKKAIREIKEFFTNGGSCDMFIEDCCKQINKDCDDIKELCKNLTTQLIGSTIKTVMPADIGGLPNPVYKIADFWMDIKTILKFIKDLITLVIDIINCINKLARIMLNGFNNLMSIIKQLMELIGLKWLMDLIQSVIDAFGDNISSVRERLENTLSPVYFSDTDEYNNTIEALEDMLESNTINKGHIESLVDSITLLEGIGNINGVSDLIGKFNDVKKMSSVDEKKVEKLLDELDNADEYIVAYKSPLFDESTSTATVSGMVDNGESLNIDIKLKGWRYFHPNLDHTGTTYYGTGLINKLIKRIKSKIIKRAAKTGHKVRGGVNKLKITNVGRKITKIDTAYVAFYWYTYYTEDLEKECFDKSIEQGTTIVDSIIQTQNGSVVKVVDADGKERQVFVADNMIRSGDYVNVEGVRYRVK